MLVQQQLPIMDSLAPCFLANVQSSETVEEFAYPGLAAAVEGQKRQQSVLWVDQEKAAASALDSFESVVIGPLVVVFWRPEGRLD